MKPKKSASSATDERPATTDGVRPLASPPRRSTVAKVSHTLSVALAERLEEFAFFQRVSESAVIEHCLQQFFKESANDAERGDILRREGAGRRRKT